MLVYGRVGVGQSRVGQFRVVEVGLGVGYI